MAAKRGGGVVGIFGEVNTGDFAVFLDKVEVRGAAIAGADELGDKDVIGFGDEFIIVVEVGDFEMAVGVDVGEDGALDVVGAGVMIIVTEDRNRAFSKVGGDSIVRVGRGLLFVIVFVWGFWVFSLIGIFERGDGFVFFFDHGF